MQSPLVQFNPSREQELLVLSAVQPGELASAEETTLFVKEIYNNRRLLPLLYSRGYRHIVTTSQDPANLVLANSPAAEFLTFRVANPDLVIYKILEHSRKNPDNKVFQFESKDVDPDESHFEKIIGRYSSWAMAWWREVIQNSVDACIAARKDFGQVRGEILCEIRHIESTGNIYVSVSDNGVGMDQETLVKAFLKPSGSTKGKGPEATGGLGKAKELLYHAFPKWVVHTRRIDAPADEGIFAQGKYAPHTFRLFGRPTPSTKIPEEYEGRWIGYKDKKNHGTKIIVEMKPDKRVNKSDLEKILSYSSLPGIAVRFREVILKPDKTLTTLDGTEIDDEDSNWELIEAENRIPAGTEPRVILTRSDGSPWAEVYYMPRAKKFKDVVVRINGLYMFPAASDLGLPGKVIIELKYKPKAMVWDAEYGTWEPMSPDEAVYQRDTHYGPMELLTENRDSLQWVYENHLKSFLQTLIKEPEQTLKKRRQPTVSRSSNLSEPKNWDVIYEKVSAKQIMDDLDSAIKKLEPFVYTDVVTKLQDTLAGENIKIMDKESVIELIKGQLTPNDISKLQKLQDKPEIKKALEDDFNLDVDALLEPSVQEAINTLVTSIDTSASWDLWEGELMPDILKDAKKRGLGDAFVDNAVKFLYWEPDFILFDETGSDTDDESNRDHYGHLYPKAPEHFHPTSFGRKEKRLAKFWTEALRLAFILTGRGSELLQESQGLQVGFRFENPPDSDEAALVGEYLGVFHTEPGLDGFRGIFLAPGRMSTSPQRSSWTHRYQLSSSEDVATIVAIAYHEVMHALGNSDHDVKFANVLTNIGLRHTYLYSSMFNKLVRHVAQLYPRGDDEDKENSGGSKPPKAVKSIKSEIESNMGFYRVKLHGPGRPPEFAKLREVLEYLDAKHPDGGPDYKVEAYYLSGSNTKENRKDATYLGSVWYRPATMFKSDDPEQVFGAKLEELRNKLADSSWEIVSRDSYDIFRRRRYY